MSNEKSEKGFSLLGMSEVETIPSFRFCSENCSCLIFAARRKTLKSHVEIAANFKSHVLCLMFRWSSGLFMILRLANFSAPGAVVSRGQSYKSSIRLQSTN